MTEIAPESVNEAYVDSLVNDGIDLAKYRVVVRGDVIRQKLEDKVVAEATKAGPQREVSQIYLSQETVDLPDEAVKVRHILYSPKDSPGDAQSGTIPADDPSWAQAKTDADAAYAKLQADPTQFDAIARAESDEESARGATGTGGELGAYVSTDSRLRRVVLGADPRRQADRRPAPAADQDRVRVPHRPGHQPRAGPGQDQDPDRRWRRLREARPRLLGR